MSTERDTEAKAGDTTVVTANDRFKRSFGSWLWGSMIVATVDVGEDLTIPRTTFRDNPVRHLPPPTGITRDTAEVVFFTPFTVKPDIKNRAELSRAMEREYPALNRDRRAQVWISVPITFTARQ